MRVNELQRKVASDPDYAAQLAQKVMTLFADGTPRGDHKADAWKDVLGELAENPEELARLMAVNDPVERRTWTTVTIACTTATTTTFLCGTTTTTSVATVTTVQTADGT